jgi:hypothetical protein
LFSWVTADQPAVKPARCQIGELNRGFRRFIANKRIPSALTRPQSTRFGGRLLVVEPNK